MGNVNSNSASAPGSPRVSRRLTSTKRKLSNSDTNLAQSVEQAQLGHPVGTTNLAESAILDIHEHKDIQQSQPDSKELSNSDPNLKLDANHPDIISSKLVQQTTLDKIMSPNPSSAVIDENVDKLVDNLTNTLFTQLLAEAVESTLAIWKLNHENKPGEKSDYDLSSEEIQHDSDKADSSDTSSDDDDDDDDDDIDCTNKHSKRPDQQYNHTDSFKHVNGAFVDPFQPVQHCTSPDSISSRKNLLGLFAALPNHLDNLIHLGVKHFWDRKSQAKPGCQEQAIRDASLTPPEEFKPSYLDESDFSSSLLNQNGIRFLSRPLLFDVIGELIQTIYEGEDSDDHAPNTANALDLLLSPKHKFTSAQYRLWRGPRRPSTFDALFKIVQSEIKTILPLQSESDAPKPNRKKDDFGFDMGGAARYSRLAQWTLSKKSGIDRLLEIELRSDEASWLFYMPEERSIKAKLADQLWQEILDDALTSVLELRPKSKI